MIRALSLAAALAVLSFSTAASAQTSDPKAPAKGQAEAALESAAERFEARMEEFGRRAEAVSQDRSLTETQREMRVAAMWNEYQPDVMAFTAQATRLASTVAAEALAGIDIEALVLDALSEVDLSGALSVATGMAANGAWASDDPEHQATYGLMADYVLGQAEDAVAVAVTPGT